MFRFITRLTYRSRATDFTDIFHSLDVWHKSKSIRKCLGKVAALRGMKKVKEWTDHIIRHFWYCCSACKPIEGVSDQQAEEIMKDKWIGLLHHVTNSHEWVGGQCDHDTLVDHDNLKWFDRRDKDFEALQKVILEPLLLSSFKYYVRFRHTGSIECVNSLSLAYASKRCSYSYKAYRVRKQLSAIDWNYHIELPTATSKTGEMVVSRKFNPRTREWTSKTIKEKKGYEYIPILTANILKLRTDDGQTCLTECE
ncbi:hypothetical protein QZH41_017779 [Actinostola sp. cb2023]|nr:hypothetical protein QZH41_017779 [Actinostola sp. cb2023]